jgi:hypothetical protein
MHVMILSGKLSLYSVLLSLLMIQAGEAIIKGSIDNKGMLQRAAKESIEKTPNDKDQLKPVVLKEEISYNYYFDADDINFLPGLVQEQRENKTRLFGFC